MQIESEALRFQYQAGRRLLDGQEWMALQSVGCFRRPHNLAGAEHFPPRVGSNAPSEEAKKA
jgi:hypothetical protein